MSSKLKTFFLKEFKSTDILSEVMYLNRKLQQTSRIEQNTIFLSSNDINEKFA